MSNSPVNRVEAALSQWRSKEERFTRLFSFSLSTNKALLKEKLEHYDRVAAKYKGTRDPDERMALRILRQERNHINKQLYPNLFLRILRRLLVAPVKEQIAIRQDIRKTEHNSQLLHQQVQRAGFPDISAQVMEQMKQGQQEFSIPVSYYLNEKERLDHQLSFIKDQSGLYQFEGFKTTLYNTSGQNEKQQQYFSMSNGYNVNTTEAYNLLSGRSIQTGNTWMQLDFNDKDANGNFRLKHFQSDYGYDLEKVLQQLPLKELLNRAESDKLQEALKNGNRTSVSFLKDGKEQRLYIEANPQFKTLNIYDEHSGKISLQTALGNKTADAMKVAHKVNEQQEQNQARKNGMRVL